LSAPTRGRKDNRPSSGIGYPSTLHSPRGCFPDRGRTRSSHDGWESGHGPARPRDRRCIPRLQSARRSQSPSCGGSSSAQEEPTPSRRQRSRQAEKSPRAAHTTGQALRLSAGFSPPLVQSYASLVPVTHQPQQHHSSLRRPRVRSTLCTGSHPECNRKKLAVRKNSLCLERVSRWLGPAPGRRARQR
jgi:hypothetical protein